MQQTSSPRAKDFSKTHCNVPMATIKNNGWSLAKAAGAVNR